jgi:hypothetical protein
MVWALSGHLRKLTIDTLNLAFNSHYDLTEAMLAAHGLKLFPGHSTDTKGMCFLSWNGLRSVYSLCCFYFLHMCLCVSVGAGIALLDMWWRPYPI